MDELSVIIKTRAEVISNLENICYNSVDPKEDIVKIQEFRHLFVEHRNLFTISEQNILLDVLDKKEKEFDMYTMFQNLIKKANSVVSTIQICQHINKHQHELTFRTYAELIDILVKKSNSFNNKRKYRYPIEYHELYVKKLYESVKSFRYKSYFTVENNIKANTFGFQSIDIVVNIMRQFLSAIDYDAEGPGKLILSENCTRLFGIQNVFYNFKSCILIIETSYLKDVFNILDITYSFE